jgi:hypothetical protein
MFPIEGIFVVRSRSAAVCLGIFALIAACWSAGAWAAPGLYAGQVPVGSQSDAERTEALKTALAQVVIRVSGDSGALARPDVAKAVADAERYVQQFSYQQDIVTEAGQPQIRLTLIAQFDRDAVDQLLRNLGLLADAAPPSEGQVPAVEATPGSYRVWVAGVRSPQDYARLIGALSGNEFVRDVQVEQARGDGVQVRLTAATSLSRLLDNLSAGAVIRVAKTKPPVEGLDALLDLQP